MGGGPSCGCASKGGCWPRHAPAKAPTEPSNGHSQASSSSASSAHHRTISVARRLWKLRELDEYTRVPFILIELRGHGHRNGFIEICGKDEYGVYEALDAWLLKIWKCERLDAGDFDGRTGRVPFCDALYRWEGFTCRDSDGVNNMGLATMQLVNLMCRQLSWTLGVINGGNVGPSGDVREQQIIFKAPHPMNLVVPHLLVELRTVGSISLSGDSGAMDALHGHWVGSFGAQRSSGHERFCQRHYTCRQDVFKERGKDGENNLGWITTKVCDDLVKLLPGWSLVTMSGGNHGRDGTHREQQLVFRRDAHPLGQAPHFLVELREAGFVQETGQNIDGVQEKLREWLLQRWSCSERPRDRGSCFYERQMGWEAKDMMQASAEITSFFHRLGWQMQACSQGSVAVGGRSTCRERQLLFRPRSSSHGRVEPHLFIELYTGEWEEDGLHDQPGGLQVPRDQHISISEVGDCGAAAKKLRMFIGEYLGGWPRSEGAAVSTYNCKIFLSRGYIENNLGLWTMRICDFMVDRLGWSFVVCNVCNLGASRHIRQQQLIFRYDGDRPEIPVVKSIGPLQTELFKGMEFPPYWCVPEVRRLSEPVAILPCSSSELSAMQEIFDATFNRAPCKGEVHRLEVVHAFRSENAELYRRFMERRCGLTAGGGLRAKTALAGGLLNKRLSEGEALLAHGTNPSSAMGILRFGFRLENAGKSTGKLYGHGVYLAECVSQADRYACDDSGGNYPELRAMLLCRSFVGRPHVVQESGDHTKAAKAAGCDCIVGDREAKLGLFREFVFFDERQVLPEYAVIYRRQHCASRVPLAMRWPFSACPGAAKQAAKAVQSLQCLKQVPQTGD